MNSAKEHYDNHLAAVYSWTAGGAEAALERNRAFFYELGIDKLPRGLAVDLGAGSGFQAIPLAELGFSVVAVDFSSALLSELKERAHNLPIRCVQDDIIKLSRYVERQQAQIIVCMGDTLTHLESFDDVRKLLSNATDALNKDGMLILTFRDYISSELHGTSRFIPVRADDSKIFTCFLEYRENKVEVYDLLYEKEGEQWALKISSYSKLRLDQNWVSEQLQELGFTILLDETNNQVIKIVSKKN